MFSISEGLRDSAILVLSVLVAALASLLAVAAAPVAVADGWQRCEVFGRQLALYGLKARNESCGMAKEVAKEWDRRALWQGCRYENCAVREYECGVRDRRESELNGRTFWSFRVVCRSGLSRVAWSHTWGWAEAEESHVPGDRGAPADERRTVPLASGITAG